MFGPLRVRGGGRELGPRDFAGAKPKQVLEILLLERGRPVSKDRLADLLWGESLPRNVSATLESYVSVLRRRLETVAPHAAAIVTERGAYRFAAEHAEVDLDRFDDLIARAARAGEIRGRDLLQRALSLVRGDVLEDEPYAPWAAPARDRYRGVFLRVLLDEAETAIAQGDYGAALLGSQRAVSAEPLNERGHRLIMMAFYALGSQQDALRAYERCRDLLREELGVEPQGETRDLHSAIRRHDDACSVLPAPPPREMSRRSAPSTRSPGPFVGRVSELAAIDDAIRLAMRGAFALVLVEGASGTGKTGLLEEALASVADVRIGKSSCCELERGLPYVAIARALRDALPARVARTQPDPGLGLVLPELATTRSRVPVPRLHAFEAVVTLVSAHAPLVLAIDDLQWADADSLALLDYLGLRCSRVPLGVVATVREDGAETSAVTALRPTARLRLGPLPAADVDALGIPGLHDKTGGHAAFVAEWLREGSSTAGSLPAGLRTLVQERCRAQGPAAQRALLAAAALDRPFEPEGLARALGSDPFELAELLDTLVSRGLLRPCGFGFEFQSEVVSEALRRSLSPARLRLTRLAAHGPAEPESVDVAG